MNSRKTYWIVSEPRENEYRDLLHYLGTKSSKFSLVVRNRDRLSSEGHALLDSLAVSLSSSNLQSAWPGTQLHFGATAEVNFYLANAEAIASIKDQLNGLYSWISPSMPQDLAFYRGSDQVIFGSSAHERFAYLELVDEELSELTKLIPHLQISSTLLVKDC